LNCEVPFAAGDDSRAPAFVDCEFGIEELAMVRYQPPDSRFTASFFIRRRYENHVARELLSFSEKIPLDQKHCHHVRGEHPLVVERSAAVHMAVPDHTAERVARPFLGLDSHYIHVREQQHWSRALVASDASHDCTAVFSWNQ
jgi:hypothetical protein